MQQRTRMMDALRVEFGIDYSDMDVDSIISRFHFTERDRDRIAYLCRELLSVIEPVGYYTIRDNQAYALITLGRDIDDLTDAYNEDLNLVESYMCDCIGLYILTLTYRQLISEINGKYNCRVRQIRFIGDDIPVTFIPKVFEMLGLKAEQGSVAGSEDIAVTYNSSYVLSPLKSVCMVMPLDISQSHDYADETYDVDRICNTCDFCGNADCPVRTMQL